VRRKYKSTYWRCSIWVLACRETNGSFAKYPLVGDETEMTGRRVSFPSVMDIYHVTEMFSRYYVDPVIAQQNVPSKWKVKIHDNGKAVLLVMVQNCKKMVLDYILNVGSVGMSHVWIELEGTLEVVSPLPGTSRSLPTWYWYILPHQLNDRWTRLLFGLVGVAAQSVRKVTLGG